MLFYAHVGTCNLDVQEFQVVGSPFGGAAVFQVVVPLLAVQPCKEQSQQLMN